MAETTYQPGDQVAWQGPKGLNIWIVTAVPGDGTLEVDAVDGSRIIEYAPVDEVALVR